MKTKGYSCGLAAPQLQFIPFFGKGVESVIGNEQQIIMELEAKAHAKKQGLRAAAVQRYEEYLKRNNIQDEVWEREIAKEKEISKIEVHGEIKQMQSAAW